MLDTSAGPIAIEFFTDKAPTTVRQFMRLAAAGVYNGMAFHRVAPGFVIQTGALSSRTAPLTEKQQKLVHNLAPEFNDTKHVKGIVSMARGRGAGQRADVVLHLHRHRRPRSTVSTRRSAAWSDGMPAVDAIEASPRNGEAPIARVDLKTVRIEKK
mgnify:CR=1 FL=1